MHLREKKTEKKLRIDSRTPVTIRVIRSIDLQCQCIIIKEINLLAHIQPFQQFASRYLFISLRYGGPVFDLRCLLSRSSKVKGQGSVQLSGHCFLIDPHSMGPSVTVWPQ